MVDRCVCSGMTFADMLKVRDREGFTTFEELRDWTGCCLGCGTCEPYVRLSISTGRTAFPVLSLKEVDEIMRAARDEAKKAKQSRRR